MYILPLRQSDPEEESICSITRLRGRNQTILYICIFAESDRNRNRSNNRELSIHKRIFDVAGCLAVSIILGSAPYF